jgi:hypothetical protein
MASFVTPIIALIVFVIVLLIAFVASLFLGNSFQTSRLHVFLACLSGLSIVITFLFYYSVVELQQQQQKLTLIQETSRISDSVLDSLMNEIKESVTIIPNFVASITPLNPCNDPPEDPNTQEACTQKLVLSYKVFSIWQDVLLSSLFVDLEPVSYITSFLQRAHSPQLLEQWTANKINFNSRTQQFGDLLFEYGIKIEPQTPESYVTAAEKFIEDQRYIDIR